MPTVSLDSGYRTLWTLADLGLLTTLGPRHDRVRFDANMDGHHHFVCTGCGLVRDFESQGLHQLKLPECLAEFGRVHSTISRSADSARNAPNIRPIDIDRHRTDIDERHPRAKSPLRVRPLRSPHDQHR